MSNISGGWNLYYKLRKECTFAQNKNWIPAMGPKGKRIETLLMIMSEVLKETEIKMYLDGVIYNDSSKDIHKWALTDFYGNEVSLQ
jgi:hypothetical protein